MRRARVEVNRVAGAELRFLVAVAQRQLACNQIQELKSRVHVRFGLHMLGQWNELGEVWVHVPVGNHVAEALKRVSGRLDAGLRHAHAVLFAVYAENWRRLGLKEIRKILGEDHGDARQIAERGHNPAGLKLREKAGRKAGMLAQFHQAHGLLEAQTPDALAQVLLGDESLGGVGVRQGFVHLFAIGLEPLGYWVGHCRSSPM